MANGPFGNPLTTGIALTFDVDMTPYDNMLKRNAAKAAEKAKADKDLLDKYNEYAKNITVDFDKIDYRLHDKARAKYAETLAELNKAVMNKDLHAANMLMMDSKQFNSNLVQRTTDLNEIFNQDPTKVYYNPEIEKIWKDRSVPNDDKRIVEIISKYGSQDELIGSFKKAPSRRNLKTDVDNLLKGAIRRLQPGDKPTMYLPTGEAVYEPKYTNKDEISNQVIMDYTSPQNIESTIYMLTEDYGISPSELQGKDIPETQEKLTNAINRVFDPIWSSIESEQYKSRFPKEGESKGWSFGGGGAKSPNWEVNKVSNIPVSLTDEVGGSLSGWKVDYTKQTGQKELQRSVELGKGAYFAEGGKKIHKISDSATGMGMVIEATPAGIYVRDDKKGGQVWAAYETNYMPPKDDLMKGFKFDPNRAGTEAEQRQAWMNISMESDKDMISETKRIVYVPLSSENEKIEFRTAMGMSSDEFNKLLKEIGVSSSTGSSSNVMTQAEFDAAWAKLKPGEKLTSPDGTTVYTK
jgi:hypothetical protein